jgi:uncharacterized membrane protein
VNQAFQAKQVSDRFEALDAWRGIAALAIAIYHFSPRWGGYLAVDFFFYPPTLAPTALPNHSLLFADTLRYPRSQCDP